jgi:hypothetical protein
VSRAVSFLFALAVMSLLPLPASSTELLTPNTLRLASHETGASAGISDMSWLAGTWRGEGLGGINEEHWSAPAGGAMMGMYRHIKERTEFYELLTLTEQGGSLLLTLRHFHADLRAWEERDVTVRMPFIKAANGRFYFEGLTFEPRGDTLTVYLAIRGQTTGRGDWREATFTYRRESP